MFRDRIEIMTEEEVKQRTEAISRLPHLLLVPNDLRGNKEIEKIVIRYNELRMKENLLDLEEMRFLSNKFKYLKFMKQEIKETQREDYMIDMSSKENEDAHILLESTLNQPTRMTMIASDELIESFLDDYIKDIYGVENPATKEEEIPLASEIDQQNLANINEQEDEMLSLDKFIESMGITKRGL